jgi:hypothetical protein
MTDFNELLAFWLAFGNCLCMTGFNELLAFWLAFGNCLCAIMANQLVTRIVPFPVSLTCVSHRRGDCVVYLL